MIRVLLETEPPPSLELLAAGERARAAAMRIRKRRDEFVLGRWAAKRLIAIVLQRPPDDTIEVRATPSGAPRAFVDGTPLRASISISHREGLALAAFDDTGAPLGADLEYVEPRSEAFVRDYFTPAEAAAARDDLLANVIWSAKESALKALGEGLRADTRSVEITLLPATSGAWHSFDVRGANTSHGWWRTSGKHVLTVVGASEPQLLP